MKKRKITAIFLAGAVMLGGCGKAAITAEEPEKAQEETLEEEIVEEEAAEDAEAETEPEDAEEKESEIEEVEEELPVYEEDKNVYGNTIGNIYNDGTFLYNEEDGCIYFQNLYSGRFVKTVPETGHTVNLSDKLPAMFSINLYDGKLYGVEITNENQAGVVYTYDLQSGDVEVLREDTVDYLQVVDGTLYFTDLDDNTLRKMDAESREETVLVNEPVYCPVVYKDIIVFQLDSDKESLYSIPRDGGEMTKINDIRSYDPVIYQDRIYYEAVDGDEQSTLRSMNLDGSDEEIILSEDILSRNLYEGMIYYVLQDTPNKVFYIDLSDETREVQNLELSDSVRRALKNAYGVSDVQITRYASMEFSGGYMIFMERMNVGGQEYDDEFIYKMDTGELFIIPEYCKERESDAIEQETGSNEPSVDAGESLNSEPAASNSTAAKPESDKDAQARAVAQSIADSIPAGSDLQRVSAAAAAVAEYCNRATYTSEDPDYRTAYGLFCKGVYTCAGSTRALGLVLECMGYTWSHVNENQWTHQWCELTMDGQKGWADGMGGVAGYGEYPYPVEP